MKKITIGMNQAAVCSFIHSLKASSIRVCQPLPVERKYSTTSGLYRIDNNTLCDADKGRPSFISLPPSYKSACSKNSSVNSGSSSYSSGWTIWASNLLQSLSVFFDFSFISFPHSKYMAIVAIINPTIRKREVAASKKSISRSSMVLARLTGS